MRSPAWIFWSLALGLMTLPALAGAQGLHASFTKVRPDLYYLYGTLPPAWSDLDADGDPDLPIFRNDGRGVFRELTNVRDLLQRGNYHGASWCDYDKDGLPDLALLCYPPPATRTLLLHNLGDGAFEDVAPALGMDVVGQGETAVWGDFNADGWPDLFTPYYGHVPPFRSFLYLNDGHGGFVEAARDAGVAMENQPIDLKPEGAHAVDWDDDGDLDLYCASHLFLNDGSAHFTDVRAQVGLPRRFDEGAMFVDYDDDGDLDLYVRNIDTGRLYRNEGGRFTDVTAAAGIPPTALLWGDNWADLDHDGDLDLVYFVRGAPAQLLLNQGNGTLVADSTFAALRLTGGFVAFADIDRDGDLDLATGALPTTLYLNRLDAQPGYLHTGLRVRVLDADGLRTQMGATVRLRRVSPASSRVQTRVVDGGSGYLTQNEYDVFFGVEPQSLYELSVSFPSAPGHRVLVDKVMSGALALIRPDDLASDLITVSRDGRVSMTRGVAGILTSSAGCTLRSASVAGGAASPIHLALPAESRVSLAILDLNGRRVRRLVDAPMSAGDHTVTWDRRDDAGRDVPAGVFFVQAEVLPGRTCVQRVVVLR